MLGFLGLIFFIFSGTNTNISSENDDYNNASYEDLITIEDIDDVMPKTSWYNNSEAPISIDELSSNNWAWARTQPWCSKGDGSWADPYVIENVTIDATGAASGSGIFIENSRSAYFKINNCTVFNAPSGTNDAGIRFENSTNGTIINNNCSNNGRGGIWLRTNSVNNTVINNTASFNAYGILSSVNSDYNSILNNSANNNTQDGIYLGSADYNVVMFNDVFNNSGTGIYLTSADYNNVTSNFISDNGGVGFWAAGGCSDNIFTGNTLIRETITIGISSYEGMNSFDGVCTPITIDENGAVPDSLTWEEAAFHVPWIDGDGSWGNPYLIEDLEVDGSGYGSGIVVNNSKNDYFTIRNCTVYNVDRGTPYDGGIFLENACNGTIFKNDVSNNEWNGIYLENGCSNNTISENIGIGNDDCGLRLQDFCSFNLISNNNFSYSDPTDGLDGILIENGCFNNTIINNTVNNNNRYGIILNLYCHNNTINNNTAKYNERHGIYIWQYSSENIILYNTANDNGASGSYDGIRLDDECNYNNILNNTCIDNTFNGIGLYDESFYNYVAYNNLSENHIGLTFSGTGGDGCDFNTITKNNMSKNDAQGIIIFDGSDNNTIIDNIISNNIGQGILINFDCSDNLIAANEINGNSWAFRLQNLPIDNTTIIGNIANGNTNGWIDGSGTNTVNAMNCIDGICTPILIEELGASSYGFTWAEALKYVPWFKGDGSWGNPYIIENLIVDAGGAAGALHIEDSTAYFIIQNCVVNNSGSGTYNGGIKLERTGNGTILNNTCYNNPRYGIVFDMYCDNHTVINNTARDNSVAGIFLRYSNDNNITGNKVYNNIDGIYLSSYSDNNIVFNNTIYTNTGAGAEGIRLANHCDKNLILNNTIRNTDVDGILLVNTCHNNSIIGNIIYYSIDNGIHLQNSCQWNNITRNSIINNTNGIYLFTLSSNNLVWDNIIKNSSGNGVSIEETSNSNTFWNNSIWNNNYGVNIVDPSCDYNVFYSNNFTGNIIHAFDFGTIFDNSFNNSVIGNYWDNYTGIDANDDGIGDTSYSISVNNYDHLPIWWDGPVLDIQIPPENYATGIPSPNFEIDLNKANFLTTIIWYRLWNASYGYTNNKTITSLTGVINQTYWDLLGNGTVIIQFFANDSRGYFTNTNRTILKNIFIPSVDINATFLYDGMIVGTNAPYFEVSLSTNIGGTELNYSWYQIFNGSWSPKFFFTTNDTINQTLWSYQANGTLWIHFFVNDSNTNLGTNNIRIQRDIIAPNITFVWPQPFEVIGKSAPTFVLNIIEAHLNQTWYSFDNGATNYTFTGTLNSTEWQAFANGSVQIKFYASDLAGNIGFKNITIWKDSIDPVVVINSPDYGDKYAELTPLYSISITEPNILHIWYTLDGEVFNITKLEGSIDKDAWKDLKNGEITISFFVRDKGGNIGSKTVTVLKESKEEEAPDVVEGLPFWIQALITGAISGSVGITLRIIYGNVKKKKELATKKREDEEFVDRSG